MAGNTSAVDRILTAISIKKPPRTATSITPTHNPQTKDQVLSAPQYREHIASLYDNRQSQTSKQLLQDLFRSDPDVSAAVGSYLTMSDTPAQMLFYTPDGQIDAANTAVLHKLVGALTRPVDYTLGFQLKPSFRMLCQEFRYMLMLRGAIGSELVFDKNLVPSRLQNVDMDSIEWFEKEPGVYKPRQKVSGSNEGVMLDIPSFFVAFHRRDPTKIYTGSDFVSAINTIAARQQVINDLYRIMQLTGYPRMAVKVLEEVLLKNAPASVKVDPEALNAWANERMNEAAASFSDVRIDQVFSHYDSVQPYVVNEKNPGAGINISSVVEVLNAQNQAALKTMATVIGRGNGSVQVASAEVRLAAMNADQLNVPLSQLLSQACTFLMNVYGVPGYAEVIFSPAELRPELELEPQKVLRATRLREDLSHGIITDVEYHLQVHGRLPPASAPELSGTGFTTKTAEVNTDNVSPNANGGSLSRSLVPEGGEAARSNGSGGGA